MPKGPYAISHQKWWRIFVRKLCRTALLSAIAWLSIQPAILFVPTVSAAEVPAAASKVKKKTKYKNKKQKILKGRHGKHSRRPA
jgi:hypothetical protein